MSVLPTSFGGVFKIKDKDRESLATRSLVKNQSVYGEKVFDIEDYSYRLWSTRRSKLAAAIKKGLHELPIQLGSHVLYLGAASGTTVSHISDIVGEEGVVYAVEFSPISARDLVFLAESRSNIIPIVDDARRPTNYTSIVTGSIDVVYQDVAQPDQARILFDNIRTFCSLGAWAMIAIKARSIDSVSETRQVFDREVGSLQESGLDVIERVNLTPYERDHEMVLLRVTEDL
ncbi:MAG: fibrillarin-like rRNA/tRNA 2'-O-methyltransferase [Candidatus Thorarchaeota archaeon]|nr:fibrillarin-like rRNA/tRNA 2'-O-methyltransferase [Candidatus Thorarchaeota archaeon]